MKKALPLESFDRSWCPEPVIDSHPELAGLYWKAWELAWLHVKGCDDAPQSPFMDEAFSNTTIWIWDTCFMVHFCKYAPQRFPGIQSFENFYQTMHDGRPMSLKIQHPDNPPLFAWIEYEYYQLTGDASRLARVVRDQRYLQRHFEFIENSKRGMKPPYAVCEMTAQREPAGYRWTGCPNGMDNTPRGRDDYESILWVDLLAQQALAADRVAAIAGIIGETAIQKDFAAKADERRALLNQLYWDETDGCYYDIEAKAPHAKVKVKTPASFWPMLAGAASPAQAKRLESLATNPKVFGGEMPWPSVSRDDQDFTPGGKYWRGGIWLPTAYMATKALARYGLHETAATLALNLLTHMRSTFDAYEPHTIWECYSPTQPRPSTTKDDKEICRKDFCGWSAIGPISMLIEDVLGFHRVDAAKGEIHWHKHLAGRHGIKRLRFGDTLTDIVADGAKVEVSANHPYALFVNGVRFDIEAGRQTLHC